MQHRIKGLIQPNVNASQKQLHQSAGQFLLGLNRRKDAAEVQQDSLRSAPQGLLPMVF